jgi:small ligand-binding sensory domain FIST
MSPSTFIQAHAGHADWRIALAECHRQVHGEMAARAMRHGVFAPLTLGWCYLTDYYAPAAAAILHELQQAFPGVSWVGTVGIGVAACGIEYFDEPALVLLLAPMPRSAFRLFSGVQPLRPVTSEVLPHTALVHAEGNTPDLQELLKELSERTATGYLFGGLASARTRTLHMADGIFTGGLSGVAFAAEVELVSRVSQGCQPIGPLREVTQGERNYVIGLDGDSALDSVMNDLGLDADIADEALFEALSGTLVGVSACAEDVAVPPGQFGTDTVVRNLVGVDRDNGILAIAEAVTPGMRLAFCTRNPAAARQDLVRIATEIRDDLAQGGRQMVGAIYVSCSGRGGPHFGGRNAELQVLRGALGEVPLAGFFAGGEIARHHLYGYTGVLSVFTAPA